LGWSCRCWKFWNGGRRRRRRRRKKRRRFVIPGSYATLSNLLINYKLEQINLWISVHPDPRAYLMSVDFEKPINNDQHLYERGEKLYLQRSYMRLLSSIYMNSPHQTMQELYAKVEANLEEQTYSFEAGYQPQFMLEKLIKGEEELNPKFFLSSKISKNKLGGGAFITSQLGALYNFAHIDKLYGNQPFRLAKEPTMQYYNGFAFQKYASWHTGIDDQAPCQNALKYVNLY
jgi:hypothetical protein